MASLCLPIINCRYTEEEDGTEYVEWVKDCQPEHKVVKRLEAGFIWENNDAGNVAEYPQAPKW